MPRRHAAPAAMDVARVRGEVGGVLRAVRAGCTDDGVGRRIAEASALAGRLDGGAGASEGLLAGLGQLGAVLINAGYPMLAGAVGRQEVALADASHQELLAIRARTALADTLSRANQPDEARAVLDRAARDDERMGCPHPGITSQRLLVEGKFMQRAGKARETVVGVLKQAASIRERAYGPEHQHTIDAKQQVASAMLNAGRPGNAKPILEQILPICERVHGPDHEMTCSVRMYLGRAMVKCGDVAGGAGVLREVIAPLERTQGPNNAALRIAVGFLGQALMESGDPHHLAEAEALCRKKLGISSRTHGRRHPDTFADLGDLAAVLSMQGKLDEAEPLLQRVVVEGEGIGSASTVQNARHNLLRLQQCRLQQQHHAAPPSRAARDMDTLLAGGTPNPTCATCGSDRRADGSDEPLSRCAACGVVRYCSAECQKKGWREGGHKQSCTRTRLEDKAGPEGKGRPKA